MTTSRTAGSATPAAESLLDREAIREAMARYCRGIDRLDAALIKSAYHPDARPHRHGHADTVTPWQGTSPVASMTRGTRDHTDPVFRR